ncbi:hypothetical protein [Pontibaca salina]|uniref:Uncharacterized protein n=1 Tax=Pontibaca salina TaxID=2795731 RepID=A0A934LY48_9RHOB|nr:hypothetical protein [Pontibaca salina]MBI6629367.1 hypothetical protein [Pontibaca salina]
MTGPDWALSYAHARQRLKIVQLMQEQISSDLFFNRFQFLVDINLTEWLGQTYGGLELRCIGVLENFPPAGP